MFDVSEANNGSTYTNLSEALSAVPVGNRTGGLTIKFIKNTPATYSVVKTDGVTEEPTGTELQDALFIESGTYTAEQLLVDAPTKSVTYWMAITETVDEQEVTTYTTWVITKASNDSQRYVQYRLMNTAWSTAVGDWQGVDDEPIAGSKNLVTSAGVSSVTYNKIPFNYTIGRAINVNSGSSVTHAIRAATDYVDIQGIANIIYTRIASDGTANYGLAFYDADKIYISGQYGLTKQPVAGYKLTKISVPEGAVYARFTFWANNIYGVFFFADADRDPIAAKLYNGNILDYQYNNEIPTFDGVITFNESVYKLESKHELNRIYTGFDGNDGTYVMGNRIYGLVPNKLYKLHIKDTSVPVSTITSTQVRFLIGDTINTLYRVNYTTVPDSDIAFRMPVDANCIYIGGRCDAGYSIECYIEEIELNDEGTYYPCVFRKVREQSSSYYEDIGIFYNPDYGISKKIKVNKGDTVVWSYGDVPLRVFNMGVFDENGNQLTYYNNKVSYVRTITDFGSSLEFDTLYIEVSFLLANAADSYVKVNGEIVWSPSFELSQKYIESIVKDTTEQFANVADDIDLTKYIEQGVCIEANTWQDYGSSFIIPVKAGEHYYTKIKTSNIYYGFLANNITTGEPAWVDGYEGTTKISVGDTQWHAIVIPTGCTYLFIARGFASGVDHTPYLRKNTVPINSAALQVATFNSSYNEEDTTAIRTKYCSLIRGKNTIETFLFFTDPHLTMRNRSQTTTEAIRDKYISTMQKYYNSLPLDLCICGGDWINSNDSYEGACEELGYLDGYMRKLFKNYYPIQGNHDENPYDWGNTGTTHKLSQQDVNNLMFRQNGNDYYAFDGINTKFYVLNTGYSHTYTMNTYRWQQVAWFADRLLTDNPAHAVILAHIFSNGLAGGASGSYPNWTGGIHQMAQHLVDIADAFNQRVSIIKNGRTYDYSGVTGRVECYISGHQHVDIIDTFHELPVIVTTDLQGGVYSDPINYTNHRYTLLPTFDCCLGDWDNHRLYAVRVGAGVSRTINLDKTILSVGNTASLSPVIGDITTWHAEHVIGNEGTFISVDENGVVTALAGGIAGVRAINEDGDEEYWTIKVTD